MKQITPPVQPKVVLAETCMLTNPLTGMYTKTTYYTDGTIETSQAPFGAILIPKGTDIGVDQLERYGRSPRSFNGIKLVIMILVGFGAIWFGVDALKEIARQLVP